MAPEIKGRYVLLSVGKKYDARTLSYALENALSGRNLNGEHRVALVSLKAQLALHFDNMRAIQQKDLDDKPKA